MTDIFFRGNTVLGRPRIKREYDFNFWRSEWGSAACSLRRRKNTNVSVTFINQL